MAWKDKEIEKAYFPIGEVAELLNINASQIRYWEKEFDILKPRKNAKGDRSFTKADIEKLKIIHHLVREKGFTLDGAKAHLKSKFSGEENNLRVIEKLKEVRGFLEQLKELL